MKKYISLIISSLLIANLLLAQPDTIWTKTYGGQFSDGGRSVIEAINGGYVIAGYTYSFGEGYADFYLLKTNQDGNEEWAKTYGGSNMDYAYDVCQSVENDGYVVVGTTASFGNGSKDVYVVKTDLLGNELWTATFGGTGVDHARSIIATNDGNYIICGYTESFGYGEDDIYLVKTNPSGIIIWEKTIGSSHSEMGEDIIETSDGNFLIAGSSGLYDTPGNTSGNNRETSLVKIDQDGDIIESGYYWNLLNDQGAYDDGYAVCENTLGDYYVVGGCTRESVEVMDISVIKTDSDLNIIWKENFEMDESAFYDFPKAAIKPTNDGGIVICGSFKYAETLKNDLFVMKIDSEGTEEWSELFGGAGSEGAYAVVQDENSDFVFAGHTTSYGSGKSDMWLLKLQNPLINIEEKPNTDGNYLYTCQPNPVKNSTRIKISISTDTEGSLSIYDSNGTVIKSFENLSKGKHTLTWDRTDKNNVRVVLGLYYIILNVNNDSFVQKIIVTN